MQIEQIQRTGLVSLAWALAAIGVAQAQTATETVIVRFGNFPHGANPYAPVTRDADGNFYGTTYQGGQANAGVVYKLSASGQQTVLYSFTGGADGLNPYAGVIRSSTGNLYGTTYQGGTANAGVVYRVSPSGQEKVLHSFTGGADGGNPYAGVIADSAGNLYGTAYNGGTANAGVVYKVEPSGQETVLYSFTGGADGANPRGGLVADDAGNLYGTTYAGGSLHAGVVFMLNISGEETVLHTFGQSAQGGAPGCGVIRDSAGNLYGTASTVVYRLTPAGQYTVVHLGIPDGGEASAGVVRDGAGNLYGTTDEAQQGTQTRAPYGSVYKVDTAGEVTILYRFPGPSKPDLVTGPNAGVVLDSVGNLYGTTPYGGVSGMLYKVQPNGQETVLYSFSGAPGGTYPYGGVIRDSAGNLYGTTTAGGAPNKGVLYMVDTAGKEAALYTFSDSVGWGLARDSAGNLYGTAGSSTTGLGVLFKLDSAGHYSVLYSFTGGEDGSGSNGVVLDTAGNLYGAADGGSANAGLVFKLDPAGDYAVLYSFTGGSDGSQPNYGLLLDSAGNIYGTTNEGGLGAGVIYRLDPSGQETVLYSFPGGADGANPKAGVIRDSAGNLYGTAVNFGQLSGGRQGDGVVFELDAAGNYAVLYTFAGGADGGSPFAGVVRDAAGNLYGTTYMGGSGCGVGCGVVYKVDTAGLETVLYSFTGGSDGAAPESGVILNPAGNLYGATPFGGKGAFVGMDSPGAGVIYKVTTQ